MPGISLLESLLVIIIIATISLYALPQLSSNIATKRAHSTTVSIQQLLQTAHIIALTQHTIVTLCGSTDDKTCDGNWQHDILLFKDPSKKRMLNPSMQLTRQLSPNTDTTIHLAAFPTNRYLSFDSKGLLNNSNGTFTITAPGYATKITLSKTANISMEKSS